MAVVRNLLAALIGLGCLTTAALVKADVLRQQEIALSSIRMAAQQRLLSQRIAKALCFKMLGIQDQLYKEETTTAVATFNANAHVLRNGGGDTDLPAIQDAAILDQLDDISQMWAEFGPASLQIAHGDYHSIPITQILYLNDPVMERADVLVTSLEEKFRASLVARQKLISTLNMAGRQSMLTQKMAKEVCFIHLDIRAVEMRAALGQTLGAFETGMKVMEFGDFDLGIIDPPSLAAIKQVMEMKDLWATIRPRLFAVAEGADLPGAQMRDITLASGQLLDLSDGMIAMYLAD